MVPGHNIVPNAKHDGQIRSYDVRSCGQLRGAYMSLKLTRVHVGEVGPTDVERGGTRGCIRRSTLGLELVHIRREQGLTHGPKHMSERASKHDTSRHKGCGSNHTLCGGCSVTFRFRHGCGRIRVEEHTGACAGQPNPFPPTSKLIIAPFPIAHSNHA